jgi:aldehyde:ferredoxin oxidoreductase
MGGYQGKLLHVDLTTGKFVHLPLATDLVENFVGGKGFGANLLYQWLKPEADPLGPDNVLMLMVGPLTGTLAPAMRGCVVTKSPLTNTFVDSYYGGHFNQEIKFAGYDGIIITGRAAKPVYLYISDEQAELRDAEFLWGRDTFAANKLVKGDLRDETVKVLAIGQAGENLVKYALISGEGNRQAGRGGTGAVMGSKNLKAVAIKGTKAVGVAYPREFEEAIWEAYGELDREPAIKALTDEGTASAIIQANLEHLLPAFNYRESHFKDAAKLAHNAQSKAFWLRNVACQGCPICCSKVGYIRSGRYAGTISDIVEYENIAMMGANLGISDIKAVAYLVQQCDALGLDGMSTGGVIGFAIEAFQKGVISSKDTGGMKLEFGKPEVAEYLIDKIVSGSSWLGQQLAAGVKEAAAALGKDSWQFAVHVKGLESPAWGPRSTPGMGLAYMTGDRGGCHQRGFPITYECGTKWNGKHLDRTGLAGKAEVVVTEQNRLAGLDTLTKCDFGQFGISMDSYAKLFSSCTGRKWQAADFYLLGERVWNQVRLLNLREGFTRADDRLPYRFVHEELLSGPHKGHKIREEDMSLMLDEYYQLRGWSSQGVPTAAKLGALGLSRAGKNVSAWH